MFNNEGVYQNFKTKDGKIEHFCTCYSFYRRIVGVVEKFSAVNENSSFLNASAFTISFIFVLFDLLGIRSRKNFEKILKTLDSRAF